MPGVLLGGTVFPQQTLEQRQRVRSWVRGLWEGWVPCRRTRPRACAGGCGCARGGARLLSRGERPRAGAAPAVLREGPRALPGQGDAVRNAELPARGPARGQGVGASDEVGGHVESSDTFTGVALWVATARRARNEDSPWTEGEMGAGPEEEPPGVLAEALQVGSGWGRPCPRRCLGDEGRYQGLWFFRLCVSAAPRQDGPRGVQRRGLQRPVSEWLWPMPRCDPRS